MGKFWQWLIYGNNSPELPELPDRLKWRYFVREANTDTPKASIEYLEEKIRWIKIPGLKTLNRT